ncbi:MAG: PQQ-dependent sugar dehydrogenase [Proteobacteria bacterium]|nr:PQQ-dependent sugar dehydrogenase [Pseudomonadota bacterium]
MQAHDGDAAAVRQPVAALGVATVEVPQLAPPASAPPPAGYEIGTGGPHPAQAEPEQPFAVTEVARLDQPWAMTFVPGGRLLVTLKGGQLKLVDPADGQVGDIIGVPEVAYGGQGGLGDVVLHPQFWSNGFIYFSYAEAGAGDTRGAVVARARLTLDAGVGGHLSDVEVVWRQLKVTGQAHYGHRIAFGRDGSLWISSGDRQKLDPAQDLQSTLGKTLRLNADGSSPVDNPFHAQGGLATQVWSLGHRNVLGMAFDVQGRLWQHEMGPAGGDELNLIERGGNYGWPIVSNGDHYDGTSIPDHDTRPEFKAPAMSWTPAIAPSGFIIYTGSQFPYFHGDGFVGGLQSQGLIRVRFDGTGAREVKRYPMGRRIRELEQGPGGAIWVLEDGDDARLLRLTPVRF